MMMQLRDYQLRLHTCPECGTDNALHTRGDIGNFYFNLQRIDTALLNQTIAQRRVASQQERFSNEIVWPQYPDGGDFVGLTIAKLRRLMVEQLRASGVPILEINTWLARPNAADRQFWLKHFTAADLRTANTTKALKAFHSK
jgi:hypothetical protein